MDLSTALLTAGLICASAISAVGLALALLARRAAAPIEQVRATLRTERAALLAEFAESITRIESIAETLDRHRRKVQQVEKRADQRQQAEEAALEPPPDSLDSIRKRARARGLM